MTTPSCHLCGATSPLFASAQPSRCEFTCSVSDVVKVYRASMDGEPITVVFQSVMDYLAGHARFVPMDWEYTCEPCHDAECEECDHGAA